METKLELVSKSLMDENLSECFFEHILFPLPLSKIFIHYIITSKTGYFASSLLAASL